METAIILRDVIAGTEKAEKELVAKKTCIGAGVQKLMSML